MDIQQIRSIAGLPTDVTIVATTITTDIPSPIEHLSNVLVDVLKGFADYISTHQVQQYYEIMQQLIITNDGEWLHDSIELKVFKPLNWMSFSSVLSCCDEFECPSLEQYEDMCIRGTFIFVLSYTDLYVVYLSSNSKEYPHIVLSSSSNNCIKRLVSDYPVLRIVLKDIVNISDDSDVESSNVLSHLKLTMTDLDVLLADQGIKGLLEINDNVTVFVNWEINQILRNWHMFSGFADANIFRVGETQLTLANPRTRIFEPVNYIQEDHILVFTDNNIFKLYGTPRAIYNVLDYILSKMSSLFGLSYNNDDLKLFIITSVFHYKKTGKHLLRK